MAELLAEHLAIPRVDRDVFMRMASKIYVNPADLPEESLRIPAFLKKDYPDPYVSTVNFVERNKDLARLETYLHQALAGNAMPVFLLEMRVVEKPL